MNLNEIERFEVTCVCDEGCCDDPLGTTGTYREAVQLVREYARKYRFKLDGRMTTSSGTQVTRLFMVAETYPPGLTFVIEFEAPALAGA